MGVFFKRASHHIKFHPRLLPSARLPATKFEVKVAAIVPRFSLGRFPRRQRSLHLPFRRVEEEFYEIRLTKVQRNHDSRDHFHLYRFVNQLFRVDLYSYFDAVGAISRFSQIRVGFRSAFFPPGPFSRSNRVDLSTFTRVDPSKPRGRILNDLLQSDTHSSCAFTFFNVNANFLGLCRVRAIVIRGGVIFQDRSHLCR